MPQAASAAENSLQKDPCWQQTLRELAARFAGSTPTLNFRFRLYRAPAGPGKTAAVGSGLRRGLWQSFGVRDGFSVDITHDILQDRAGDLWFATAQGVCRFDGARCTTFTAADGMAGEDWQPVYADRITYEELPLGEYAFQVRAGLDLLGRWAAKLTVSRSHGGRHQ